MHVLGKMSQSGLVWVELSDWLATAHRTFDLEIHLWKFEGRFFRDLIDDNSTTRHHRQTTAKMPSNRLTYRRRNP